MILTLVYFVLLFSKLSVSNKYLVNLENGQTKVISGKSPIDITASEKKHVKLTPLYQTEAQHLLESSNGSDYKTDLDFSENVDQDINTYISSLPKAKGSRSLRSSKLGRSVSKGLKSETY